jgi:hypothetical protein
VGCGDAAGGSLLLGELIDKHGEALYRDLLLFHQIDLVDLARRWNRNEETGTSPRLLLYLIEQLPEGSTFVAERMGGREHRDWNLSAYILASISNNIQSNTMITASIPKSDRSKFHMIEGPTPPKKAKKAPSFGDFLSSVAGATQLPSHLLKQ